MKDILNEAEATADASAKESEMETMLYQRRKRVGKRSEDISQKRL